MNLTDSAIINVIVEGTKISEDFEIDLNDTIEELSKELRLIFLQLYPDDFSGIRRIKLSINGNPISSLQGSYTLNELHAWDGSEVRITRYW